MRRRLRAFAAAITLVGGILALAVPVRTLAPGRQARRFAVAAGRALREWDNVVEVMQRGRSLRLREVQEDGLLPGRRHERLDQYFRGVRVLGGEVVRETDRDLIVSLNGTVYGDIGIDTVPSLSAEDAWAAFDREAGTPLGPRRPPELVVLPREDGSFVLAYRVTGFVNESLPVVFVNAKTGSVERRYDNLQTQQSAAGIGTGVWGDQKKISGTVQGGLYQASDVMRPTLINTYDLRGNLSRMTLVEDGRSALVSGDLASSPTTAWNDPAVVDAHAYTEWTYDYYYRRLAWKGLNNRDSRPVHVVSHPVKREDFAKYEWARVSIYYANAFFCPQCGANREDIMVLGEGLPSNYYLTSRGGQFVHYYAASLDIVAHEYSHGVTAYTSGLIYQNESGALNEAFSDMMGNSVEFFHQQPGSGRLKAEYLQGEDTYLPRTPGGLAGSRSLEDPATYGGPDHYSKRYLGPDDGGGVHTNSSIANHAFYLAIEGGTNRTSKLVVHGVGAANRDQIEKVFFRGFTTLTADATFAQARERTIQSARDLYGAGSAAERAVTEAWTAVGVQ